MSVSVVGKERPIPPSPSHHHPTYPKGNVLTERPARYKLTLLKLPASLWVSCWTSLAINAARAAEHRPRDHKLVPRIINHHHQQHRSDVFSLSSFHPSTRRSPEPSGSHMLPVDLKACSGLRRVTSVTLLK